MSELLSREERAALPLLPVSGALLAYDRSPSSPFSSGRRTRRYKPNELKGAEAQRTPRTDFFEKRLAETYRLTESPVPYAFKAREGDIWSLDAGCVGFLANKSTPELRLHTDGRGFIVAVEPLEPLPDRDVDPETAALAAEIVKPIDERRRRESLTVVREGAQAFRRDAMANWRGVCLFSGCRVRPSLEAAHIFPYAGRHTNSARNALLLRADIHRLFDKFLISARFTEIGFERCISPSLVGTPYEAMAGVIPLAALAHRPAESALDWHYHQYLARMSSSD